MQVVFDHTESVAQNIKTFWFKPTKQIVYMAGQYTEIQLPHTHPDERGIKRWFTISSSPTDNLVSITTKFTPKRGSTFKRTLASLKPGTKLNLAGPMGDFVLPKDRTIPLLFVAGGMGITPMHSMVKWLKDTNEQRNIHLVYAVSSVEQLAFQDLFASYNLKFTPIVKEPTPDWKGEVGRLTADRVINLAGNDSRTLIYISGPEPMVETLVHDMGKLGVKKNRLVTDYFPGYPAP